MIPTDSRRGASNLGIPLMIAAFALMGGFLYWLSATAEPTPPPVMEGDAAEVDEGPVANRVQPSALERAAADYVGQMVRVENVPFARGLGDVTFFVQLPQGSPFLVRMTPDMIAAGEPLPSGHITVVGRIRNMTDSIMNDWLDTGTVPEADRPLVDFATQYMALEAIRPGIDPAMTAPTTDTMDQGGNPSEAGN